jgi:hypothetical protein
LYSVFLLLEQGKPKAEGEEPTLAAVAEPTLCIPAALYSVFLLLEQGKPKAKGSSSRANPLPGAGKTKGCCLW